MKTEKLTVANIQDALNNPQFYYDETHLDIIERATKQGYVRRISTTQAEWTEEGLEILQSNEAGHTRYFLVFYSARSKEGKCEGVQTVTTNGCYVAKNLLIKIIKDAVQKENNVDIWNIVPTNINEISKEDYYDWIEATQ